MKAQQYFGGTRPKDNAKKVKQVGHSGKQSKVSSTVQRRTTVKQVGHITGGGGNNTNQVRQGKTKELKSRPGLSGKEYNHPQRRI